MATNCWCCGAVVAIFLFLVHSNLAVATKQNEDFFQFENNSLDISILKSKNEKFLIYRNTGKKECYIERVTEKNSEDEQNSRTLYVGQEPLKKSDKVYTELDDDTKNFCNQFSLFVLQEQPPTYVTKGKQVRKRRAAQMPKQTRYRSQTQSQRIFFDGGRGNNSAALTQLNGDPGNARITVSGNFGLEQSQSQFESIDCSEYNGWPQGPHIQTHNPQSPVNRQPNGQHPSNQQTGSQPQNVPAKPPVLPSGIPGQQAIPPSGSGFPASLPAAQPTGSVHPQPPGYFIPSSTLGHQPSHYLPSNTQFIPQPGSVNVPTNFQIPAPGVQPTQQSSFVNPPVNPAGPLLPPNLPPATGASNIPGPPYLTPDSRPQNPAPPGSQYSQFFPANTPPAGQYSPGNANLSGTPAYFYLILQPSQQNAQAPQYFLFNTQTIYPQNSHGVITNPEKPYFPPAPSTQTQPFPQIPSNWQIVPAQGSYPQVTGYPNNQNTLQGSPGVINPQSQPSPGTQVVPQQGSAGATNFPGSSVSNQVPSFQIGNPQPTPKVPQTNLVPQQNAGGIQPQISTLPSSSQAQPNSAGGLIFCQSCSYIPATPQHTGGTFTNPLLSHYPTGSGLFPQQNSGGLQTRPHQLHGVSYPASATDNQYSTLSQTGLVEDPSHPFQAQYIPQVYVPQQPQVIPTETRVNQPATPGYAPVLGNYPNPNYAQETIASKNYTNESPTVNIPTISQNGSSVSAVEDDVIEEALSVSSINLVNNATRAEAMSQGKTKNGIVKAEVSGTYTTDFAAKAQTIDHEKSAISQIFGNGTGAISTSYGRAGKSESQSQVLFSHETGSAVAESQGGGLGYNVAGQIQAGLRGGQSDSLASGAGNTFSQAQIGFAPIFKENFLQQSIFQGGGTAVSNISRHSGMTDIKFQGQFQSGQQLTGRVQAGAGRVSQNQTKIAFNSTNLTSLSQKDTSTHIVDKAAEIIEEEKDEERSNDTPLKFILPQPSTNNSLDTLSDFGTQASKPRKRLLKVSDNDQKSKQNGKNDIQDPSPKKFLYTGEIIPGTKNYKVPPGFRGRLFPQDLQPSDIRTSVTNSGRTTEIDYRGSSKQGKIYIQKNDLENQNYLEDGFVTVTKSETGELLNKNRNYDHTYYTKSSTCGFFTYTCNLIDGPDGRTKICKQNPPTDANGVPC